MTCLLCDIAKGKVKTQIVLRTEMLTAFIPERPATPGHLVVIPNNHYTIMEQLPDPIVKQIYTVINDISSSLLEATNAQGLSLVVNNGVSAGQNQAHFSVNLIPRYEGDGLDFTWQPKSLSETELSEIEMKMNQQPIAEEQYIEEQHTEERPIDDDSEEVDYLIKGIQRLP